MAGNVWEICSDFYHPAYYKQFLQDPHSNPKGPNRRSRRSNWSNFAPTGTCPLPQAGVNELMFLHVTKEARFFVISTIVSLPPGGPPPFGIAGPEQPHGFRCVKDADQEDLKL